MEPRFAALSNALAAAEITSEAASPPLLIASPPLLMTSRAVRTAVLAAERPMVRIDVRRWVWRMRLSAERLRFLAGIDANDTGCLKINGLADVDRARLSDHDRHPRREPGPWLAAPVGHRGAFRRDARARRFLGGVQDPRRHLRPGGGGRARVRVHSRVHELPR